ncbi:5-methylaminomethyl-2-thiouridylate-methyltransferase [Kickxella alabastrina]|uniref:5-methylaminomethyl-2-thiouridylate- methyltransferase n=1 Tax=Kickxella alabastrina TaxID=61397 RepID=UPI00221F1DC4|nr:5-methylaminomethyl-2-thiouridylate-methyltransferase [Kickxella alabastrina]KAI7829301.1 5-methylaminomethyl-2-thiouridylate-methyltransferase [Kickxella alabastrina]KAJ1947823.1 hypothetical protein GGF37_000200 [Kickxella alabastrina]
MSGGVDSSVAAHLLQSQGHKVTGIFMRNWDTRDEHGQCPSERDWQDVQRVCHRLNIKCHEVNLVKEYWNNVFALALDEYARGWTPNPDMLCNREIKFGVLLKEIERRVGGGAWFATGHYARSMVVTERKEETEEEKDGVVLYRGVDQRKDQSYYLANVLGSSLTRVVFPLGDLIKATDVRGIARDAALHTAEKEESMGICFVGERRRFDQFLAEYLPQKHGDIVDSLGHKLGTHRGMFSKTIGQSAGIPGWQDKWYVYAKDMDRNRMFAVQGRDNPLLYSSRVTAGPIHWISGSPPLGFDDGQNIKLDAQIRYMQKPQKCTVSRNERGFLSAEFEDAQFGVAVGQYLVLYNGDHCLGSAVIQ